MALKFMADKEQSASSDGALTCTREICDEFDTPFDTTAKVMQLMNAHEILKSTKGIKGGYTLNKNLKEITYMGLVRLIEGKVVGRVCVNTKGTCELFPKCNIVTPVELLNRKLSTFLETLTLAELLQGIEFNPKHLDLHAHVQSPEKSL